MLKRIAIGSVAGYPPKQSGNMRRQGGLTGQMYDWGPELKLEGKYMANSFQGAFPALNTGDDGYTGTAPVGSYPQNPYGLHDMIGNVWEWTSDWYHTGYYTAMKEQGLVKDPQGADTWFDPSAPGIPKRVTKGGSFLCADNFCINYRIPARQGTPFDSGASHIGFRCARSIRQHE